MSEIAEIAKEIHLKCSNLELEKLEMITKVINLCVTFVEVAGKLNQFSDSKSEPILTDLIDEYFVDVHISCVLAASGQFKSASVVARAALELGLYYIYFVDHRVELGAWANAAQHESSHDMSFVVIREHVCSKDYMRIASNSSQNLERLSSIKDKLQKSYRLLSERVHGKYQFLYVARKEDPSEFDVFCKLALKFTESLTQLLAIRVDNNPDIIKAVPALEKIYG